MSWQKEMAGQPPADRVQNTFETNQTPEDIRHMEMMCLLKEIKQELQKTNLYWEIITTTKL